MFTDNTILTSICQLLTQIGKNVRWLNTDKFIIHRSSEKNNVRFNKVYEEFYPLVQQEFIHRLLKEKYCTQYGIVNIEVQRKYSHLSVRYWV